METKINFLKKISLLAAIFSLAYFCFPVLGYFTFVIVWLFFGLVDVLRHRNINKFLLKKYFFSKGILTFLLSPINLLSDLICQANSHNFKLSSMPKSHQEEINEITKLFDKNRMKIEEQFHQEQNSKRTMIFYRWYGKQLNKSIPALNKEFKYIKTIGVSLFREKTSTSRHFGPLRATFRILYNFNKVKNEGSYIEADGRINKWKHSPIFIFDDTLIHQSFNEEDDLRYCAFIDIIRPSYFENIMKIILSSVGFLLKNTRSIFYKNWKMI